LAGLADSAVGFLRIDYDRFVVDWANAHATARGFQAVGQPAELESPLIPPVPVELDAGPDAGFQPVPEDEDAP
jgi:hypothetical protein